MKKTTTHSNRLSEKRFTSIFIQSFLLFGFLFGIQNSFAQKIWDGGAGNSSWSSANNWNNNTLPQPGDNVTIGNGFTVSLDTSISLTSLTIGGGASGAFTVGSGNGNFTLTVTGAVTINAGASITSTGNGGNVFNIGGNLTNAGSISDNGGDADIIFNGGTQTISGAGTFTFTDFLFSTSGTKTINSNLTVNGNWTNNGGTVGGTGTVTLAGSGTIGGSSTTAFPNLTISASGAIVQGINTTVSGNFNKTSGTYNISSSASSYTLSVIGNFTNSGGGFRVSNGANNSTLNVGGTFGLSAGTFILENSTSATGATVNVTGATTISGTGVIILDNAGTTASCAFNANDVTFSGTGGNSNDGNRTNCSLDFGLGSTVNHAQFKIAGNFVHSSTNVFYTSSTTQVGSIIFNKAGTQTLSYSGTNSQYTSITVNSGSTLQLLTNLTFGSSSGLPASTVNINGTLDAQTFIVGGASTAGEIFNLNSGATLITANTNGVFSTTVGSISNTINRNFNAGANYTFDGAANQTTNFGNASINNLTIANTGGTVTLNAAVNASGNVTVNSGSSLTAGNLTHLIAGNWTLDGGTFVPGTGTITLNGTAQAIGGTSSLINFNNLVLSGGTKTFNKQVSVSGNLSIASGALANPGSLTTHTAGTLTLGGLGTAAAKFGSTSTSATPTVFKNNTYFTSGTTGYITVSTGSCTAPTITFGTIPSICNGATSLSLPYTATTGSPDLYSIAGTGITSVTNGVLATAPSSIIVALSSPAVTGTISSSSFTVSSSVTGCASNNINGSVTVNPNVGTPNFTAGATTVCQNAADTTYTATATDSTGITYSVLPAGAGTIGSSSGVMNWSSTFSGTATITASAAGCAGPTTADRVVTVTPTVGTPSTPTPSASTICQASAPTAYTTSATNATSYTWTVTGTGNTISGTGTTGTVTWSSTFTGSATVSVRANGCNGPSSLVSTTVNVNPTVGNPSFTVGATSVCQNAANTTYTATATNNTGITYSVLPAAAGVIGSSNGIMDWDANYSGSATITATVTGCGGPKTVDRVVTITATVGTPNFTAGALTVCQNAANTTYTATASDTTGITYSVSPVAAGTIGSSSGIMDWSSTFSGTATITASAAGCNGPKTNTRVVTVTPTVGATSFTAGPTTVCQNAPNSTYTATATNTTGITYSVTPLSAGEIDSDTGEMDWDALFSGSATITALAAGCNGPTAANRVVTVTPTVGTPSFSAGATTVCQDAANTTYTASASNSTGITYSVSPPAAGTIGSSSGIMDWNSSFNGTATITASAAGCNGPKTADRLVVVNPTVGTPGFTTGATEVCQDAPDEIYTAGAPGATGITYSISPVGAGTIGSSSGIVNWNASFSGTATITASAAGCNGPKTANRIVTVTPTVGTPSFSTGALTVCQDAGDETYTATASDATGITYSISPVGAGIIGSLSGIVNWDANFSGTATITASAAGCNGPKTSDRVVTVTPTVGTPSFSAGATTVCQDAADTTYAASATSTTGITYSISPVGAGTIGSSSGIVNWDANFSGTATITASAAGCNGPKTADRVVTVTPTVGTPGFTAGALTVCQDAADTTYTATATDSTGISYSISPVSAGTIGSSSGIVNWDANFSGTATITATAAGCNGPKTTDRIVTVNALPVVTASDVSGCSGSSIALSGSGTPIGGSGNYSVANPFVGTSSTTYTYTYTDLNGCTNTSASANITIMPQPLWYLDADGDQYYTGSAIPSCTSPGAGYTTSVLGGNDCNDNNTGFNPGATDICYNNIDENCNNILSDGCAPVVVNMTASYHNTTLPSMSTAIPAVSYSYPGTTNIKYRFSIKNVTTNTTAPDIIQTSRYVTIPASIHSYNSQYTIKASAVINEEVVAYAGNTITVNSPTIQLVTLSTSNCGATLASLTSIISANPGLNATGYTFRIRLNDGNPSPTYAYSQSATRFVGANSFTGFPLQYSTSYKIAVQYTSTDASTNSPVQSGYGAECVVNTPSIPLISLASPSNNTQVAAINANISAQVAAYSTSYQFRIRASNDNGPNPTYYYSIPNPSRFSSLTAFQGISFAYNTHYEIAVQYSVIIGSNTVWSGYGPETKIKTPFFPVTSLIPSQCGLSTPTALNQQLNISPYPGFPHYKVLLEEIAGEDVVNSQEREIAYSHFKLSDFSIAQEGKSYAVSVAIKLNGVFGDYDTACDLFTASNEDGDDEGGSIVKTILPFKAKAYPNPFANNFMLDIRTSSQSSVNIKVYDMVGRLMEQMSVNVADMRATTIGNNYPSGVYNVVVSQEDSIETVRVVKR